MPAPSFTLINTLTEYVNEVQNQLNLAIARNPNISSFQNWYRGVTSEAHELQPGLFRIPRGNVLDYLNLEADMMRDFERHAILRAGTPEGDEDKRHSMLKLFHMQHYGVPTRLLDWTTNPFIALYFALSTNQDSDENPAVWVLDPWGWNRRIFRGKSWQDQGPAHVSHSAVRGYTPLEQYDNRDLVNIDPHPAAVIGIYNTERMRAQRGVFTMFGKEKASMEAVYEAEALPEGCLHKLIINRAIAKDLFNLLIQMGYTDSVSYPDFYGVALEIRRTHGFKV